MKDLFFSNIFNCHHYLKGHKLIILLVFSFKFSVLIIWRYNKEQQRLQTACPIVVITGTGSVSLYYFSNLFSNSKSGCWLFCEYSNDREEAYSVFFDEISNNMSLSTKSQAKNKQDYIPLSIANFTAIVSGALNICLRSFELLISFS